MSKAHKSAVKIIETFNYMFNAQTRHTNYKRYLSFSSYLYVNYYLKDSEKIYKVHSYSIVNFMTINFMKKLLII